jgi:hypothetical protein
LSSRWQPVTEDRQAQPIPFCTGLEIQVGPLGDDPLIAHQPGETLLQIAAGHQCITHDVQRGGTHLAGHVQADRRVAGNRHRTLPQAGHIVLRKTRIGIAQGRIIETQFAEQLAAVDPC